MPSLYSCQSVKRRTFSMSSDLFMGVAPEAHRAASLATSGDHPGVHTSYASEHQGKSKALAACSVAGSSKATVSTRPPPQQHQDVTSKAEPDMLLLSFIRNNVPATLLKCGLMPERHGKDRGTTNTAHLAPRWHALGPHKTKPFKMLPASVCRR